MYIRISTSLKPAALWLDILNSNQFFIICREGSSSM